MTVWKNIRPKLEILLAQEKDDRAVARERRLRIRHEEIRVLYDAFVSERFPEDERCFFPNRCDISSLPSIKELAQTNDARATITMDLFATIEDRLLSDIQQHACRPGAPRHSRNYWYWRRTHPFPLVLLVGTRRRG